MDIEPPLVTDLPDILVNEFSIEDQTGRLPGDNFNPYWPRETHNPDKEALIAGMLQDIRIKLSKPVNSVPIEKIAELFRPATNSVEKSSYIIKKGKSGGLKVEFYNLPNRDDIKSPGFKYIFDNHGRMIQEEHFDGQHNSITYYSYNKDGYLVERMRLSNEGNFRDTFAYIIDEEERWLPVTMKRTMILENEDGSPTDGIPMVVKL